MTPTPPGDDLRLSVEELDRIARQVRNEPHGDAEARDLHASQYASQWQPVADAFRAARDEGRRYPNPAAIEVMRERLLEQLRAERTGKKQPLRWSKGAMGKWRNWGHTNLWQSASLRATSAGVGALVLAALWMGVGQGLRHPKTTPVSTYATASGQRATITLPDGVTVALNVASRLDVPSDYLQGNHTVRLQGEGLFTVTHHDAATPLVVVAGTTTTRVLGTTFLVRQYPNDTTAVIAVRDGRVAVGTTVIPASRRAVVYRHGPTQIGAATPEDFGFVTGVITLRKMPLQQAVMELSRWYDVEIRLGDPELASRPISGEFAAGSLADLASTLEWTFNLRVVRNGRFLTLYSHQP